MDQTMKTAAIVPLSEANSLYLDLIRFAAALTVAYAHLTQGFFTVGWVDRTMWGMKAVAVFFVLSGFVIRFVTTRKPASFLAYGIDRASRIYSVVLPALLFTIVADSISFHARRSYYLAGWGKGLEHPFFGLLANVTFTSQLWFADISPLSDGPFWSLGYECIYYAIYGCAFYLAGKRRILWLGLLLLLAGPKIVYLFPIWLSGAALHDLYQRWRSSDRAFYSITVLLLIAGSLAAILSRFPTALSGIGATLNHLQAALNSLTPIRADSVKNSMYLILAPCLLLLLWTLLSIERLSFPVPESLAKVIRAMGESTFPLYLFHFPFFVLVQAAIPYNRASPLAKTLILTTAVLLSVAIGGPCDRLKMLMRKFLNEYLPGKKPRANATDGPKSIPAEEWESGSVHH